MGWDAVGGLAIGWNSAVGGFGDSTSCGSWRLGDLREILQQGGDGWGREFNTPAADNMVQTWFPVEVRELAQCKHDCRFGRHPTFRCWLRHLFVAATRVCRKKIAQIRLFLRQKNSDLRPFLPKTMPHKPRNEDSEICPFWRIGGYAARVDSEGSFVAQRGLALSGPLGQVTSQQTAICSHQTANATTDAP
jgi:hypothetical protein